MERLHFMSDTPFVYLGLLHAIDLWLLLLFLLKLLFESSPCTLAQLGCVKFLWNKLIFRISKIGN